MPKPDSGYRPRLAIEVTQEQRQAIQRLFPYGTQRAFFSKIIDELIKVVEIGGNRAIVAILTEAISFKTISPTLGRIIEEVNNGDTGEP